MPVTPSPSSGGGRRAWRVLAAAGLVVAALTVLGYSAWVLTSRRAIFAAIADSAQSSAAAQGAGTVSLATARSNDALNAGWLWATTVVTVVALLLWFGARVVARLRFGPVGFAGLAMLAVGLLVVVGGSYLSAMVDGDPDEAGMAVLGYSVTGGGFLLMSLGLLAGMLSLFRQPDAAAPQVGYAGWTSA
ncbi:MAG: hypothetical protein ACRDOJ_06940 [Nocardioidaceae bacterium]